jgi:dihydrofolate synthase/folylpolyglutamate synthase
MLESIYQAAGYTSGVYTSPHLEKFEERCRINAKTVSEESLVPYFEQVEHYRQGELLTYFEFTTLAILGLLSQARLDIVVLEVGMGGRLDAVNVIDTDCAIITNIDLDHTEFLGSTREAIGFEKAGIMRANRPVIVADPIPPDSVVQQAKVLKTDYWQSGHDFYYQGDQQQWLWCASPERGGRRYVGMPYPGLRGANQLLNASAALACTNVLQEQLPVATQAVKSGLSTASLPGRFQILPGQPAIVLDVAHNPHAVATLANNLDRMGFFPSTYAIFATMADKDYVQILKMMEPYIDLWYFCNLQIPRAATAKQLFKTWEKIKKRTDTKAESFDNPSHAFAVAKTTIESTGRIVVFGSFYTVGNIRRFMKR